MFASNRPSSRPSSAAGSSYDLYSVEVGAPGEPAPLASIVTDRDEREPAFTADGVGCLTAKPTTPGTTHPAWDRTRDEDLKAVLHQSPRTFGKPTGLWTLALVA